MCIRDRDYILTQEEFSPESCLFFDIETTGLSWKTSHLYLLGAVFYENEIWIHRQWFCQKPGEEKEVLLAFSELLSTRKLLLHYNGTTFDVPYLMHKYTFYQLPSPWEGTRQMDLYQLFSPLKKLLHLDHMRQKDLEQAIGLFRKDRYSGGKLIEVYKKYLLSGDEDLLEMLRLHNKEDVDGMLHLLPLFSIRALWTGNCQEFITCNHTPENNLILSVQPKYPFPDKGYGIGHRKLQGIHRRQVRIVWPEKRHFSDSGPGESKERGIAQTGSDGNRPMRKHDTQRIQILKPPFIFKS